jgi:hypothetical protein
LWPGFALPTNFSADDLPALLVVFGALPLDLSILVHDKTPDLPVTSSL